MLHEELVITNDDSGAGTARTNRPIWGHVSEVRFNGATVFIGSGTVSLTRDVDGGTILAGAPGSGTWSYAPRQSEHTQALGSIGADAYIPVDGYFTATIAGGGSAALGTIHVYVS